MGHSCPFLYNSYDIYVFYIYSAFIHTQYTNTWMSRSRHKYVLTIKRIEEILMQYPESLSFHVNFCMAAWHEEEEEGKKQKVISCLFNYHFTDFFWKICDAGCKAVHQDTRTKRRKHFTLIKKQFPVLKHPHFTASTGNVTSQQRYIREHNSSFMARE